MTFLKHNIFSSLKIKSSSKNKHPNVQCSELGNYEYNFYRSNNDHFYFKDFVSMNWLMYEMLNIVNFVIKYFLQMSACIVMAALCG